MAAKQLDGILSAILGAFGIPSPLEVIGRSEQPLPSFPTADDFNPPSNEDIKLRAQQSASNLIQGIADRLVSAGPRLRTPAPDAPEEYTYNEILNGRGHAGVEPLNLVPAAIPNPRPTSHFPRSPWSSEKHTASQRFVGSFY
eukprot:Gregarina_sp_Pseudo_9__530@NODE_1341_length_1672_cov_4_298224_g1253_i0_p3_GENE_NODE_1341_length_1672_cov_4_298224_g1253_i0NODE_1341_length_1672_cov_4_298224_g1253_i0_p3_ORF_typecomplete_len142_score20_03_NODE_1341_length_1672_cov_4_298224_g1253_i010321457